MSYTALYRKFRPNNFDSVVGQEHITNTLINQIRNCQVGHAYLFTGSRGTGKTTCAKIFAKAVNCLQPINGSPCGKCEVCKALNDPSNLDVMEIDAASNNKVDEVREIREHVKYPPVYGKFKVYIIDEVHMLTDSAFNALLKTLEEPPSHVIFILATTEAHKLPATILSRCMRFDFRLVATDTIAKLIAKVYDEEKKTYETEAVRFIAQGGEGSVRDALSIADMCLHYSDGKLKYEDVLNVLGATDKGQIREFVAKVVAGDIGGVLDKINELSNFGKSMNLIAKEIISYSRDLLVLKTTSKNMLIDTEENLQKMIAEANDYSVETLVTIIELFSKIEADLRYSVSPKIVLEATSIRACKLMSADLSALEERIARIERNGINIKVESAAPTQAASSSKPMDIRSVWGRMTTFMRTNESMALHSLIGGHTDYNLVGNKLTIYTSVGEYNQFSSDSTLDAVNRALKADGLDYEVIISKRTDKVDVDDEITKLKKLMGKNTPINIIK